MLLIIRSFKSLKYFESEGSACSNDTCTASSWKLWDQFEVERCSTIGDTMAFVCLVTICCSVSYIYLWDSVWQFMEQRLPFLVPVPLYEELLKNCGTVIHNWKKFEMNSIQWQLEDKLIAELLLGLETSSRLESVLSSALQAI